MPQSMCLDCFVVLGGNPHMASLGAESLQDFLLNVHFAPSLRLNPHVSVTTVQPEDRWPHAADPVGYCLNYLRDPSTRVWVGFNWSAVELEAQRRQAEGALPAELGWFYATASRPAFERCLHVEHARLRFGGLDCLVFLFASIILCIAITAERQQQLANTHLRRALHQPVHQYAHHGSTAPMWPPRPLLIVSSTPFWTGLGAPSA